MTLPLPVELHLQAKATQTAFDLLLQQGPFDPETLSTLFQHGAIWYQAKQNQKPERLHDSQCVISTGETLHLYCNDQSLQACPFSAELVEDHQTFSIWHKPSGMFSQGSKWADHWTLTRWITLNVWPQRSNLITHRLDRFTSGLMIVAHDPEINRQFHRLFEQRHIDKTYHAIVKGILPKNHSMLLDDDIDHKPCATAMTVLESDTENYQSLLELKPRTGRKHQIRIHLSQAGYPIVNDRQYGSPPFNGDLQLQASALKFTPPGKQKSLQISLDRDKLLSLNHDR